MCDWTPTAYIKSSIADSLCHLNTSMVLCMVGNHEGG